MITAEAAVPSRSGFALRVCQPIVTSSSRQLRQCLHGPVSRCESGAASSWTPGAQRQCLHGPVSRCEHPGRHQHLPRTAHAAVPSRSGFALRVDRGGRLRVGRQRAAVPSRSGFALRAPRSSPTPHRDTACGSAFTVRFRVASACAGQAALLVSFRVGSGALKVPSGRVSRASSDGSLASPRWGRPRSDDMPCRRMFRAAFASASS